MLFHSVLNHLVDFVADGFGVPGDVYRDVASERPTSCGGVFRIGSFLADGFMGSGREVLVWGRGKQLVVCEITGSWRLCVSALKLQPLRLNHPTSPFGPHHSHY
jgi:hypothetical protein